METPPRAPALLAEAELCEDRAVARYIVPIEVRQLSPALSDELQEPALRVVVVPVGLKVLGQGVDALREERDLDLSGPRVRLVSFVLPDHFELLFRSQR